MADPQKPTKTTGLALNGQLITLDQITEKAAPFPMQSQVTIASEYADYQPAPDVDYTDLISVNKELQNLRVRLHRLRIELKNADRQALRTRYAYEGKKKRILISLSGGSAGEREAMSELLAEEEYTEMLIATAVSKEITNHNRDIRTELETLREISNNLRRTIDLQ